MSEPTGFAMFNPGADGSVEALGKIWLDRDHKRRTRGDPRRTQALAVLAILDRDLGLADCGRLAHDLADAWAGEGGWDTQQLIKALSATKSQVQVLPEEKRGRD